MTFLGELLIPQLQQVVQEGASEDVLYLYLAGPVRVQEEEELPDRGADVERVEGFLQTVQLWEGFYQLQDVVLQVGLAEESLTSDVVEGETDPGLVKPDLPHDVVEEGHDADPAQPVALL